MRIALPFVLLLASVLPAPVGAQPHREVEVCFVLDTTGSMQGLLDAAKEKIWFIANAIVAAPSEPRARFCLLGFRDRGDAYVTRRVDLTADLDAVYRELLAFEADGGGDTPEAVNQALREVVEDVGWSPAPAVLKVVFLVGDAPPKHYADEPQYPEIVARAARRGILINPVLAGADGETRTAFRAIAAGAGGEAAELGAAVRVERRRTALDQDLAALNRRLAATLVPYGDDATRARLTEAEATAAAMDDAGVADRLAFKSRTGGEPDLIDQLASGATSPGRLEREQLPERLRSLTEPELLAHLETVRAERAELRRVITALVAEREARLAAADDGRTQGFDAVITGIVRRQLEAGPPR